MAKWGASYGLPGAPRAPATVMSSFRSDGVVALCLLLRSGAGVGATLRRLLLNDNCLCRPSTPDPSRADSATGESPRVAEWVRPPDCFDRTFVREQQLVRCLVEVPGLGNKGKLKREWHGCQVVDIKASKERGTVDFGVEMDDEIVNTRVMQAAQIKFNAEVVAAKATYKAKCAEAAAEGWPVPAPPKQLASAQQPQPRRPCEEDIQTRQESGAMAAIAEMLVHGMPPPPTPEDVLKAREARKAREKAAREHAARMAAQEEALGSKKGKKMKSKNNGVGGSGSGEGGDSVSGDSNSSSSVTTTGLMEGGGATLASPSLDSTWHLTQGSVAESSSLPEKGRSSSSSSSSSSGGGGSGLPQQHHGSHLKNKGPQAAMAVGAAVGAEGGGGRAVVPLSAEAIAFEAEASAMLGAYDQSQPKASSTSLTFEDDTSLGITTVGYGDSSTVISPLTGQPTSSFAGLQQDVSVEKDDDAEMDAETDAKKNEKKSKTALPSDDVLDKNDDDNASLAGSLATSGAGGSVASLDTLAKAAAAVSPQVWGEVEVPDWAKGTGGPFGGEMIDVSRSK